MNARPWFLAVILFAAPVAAADWPQWRGPNRDAKVTGFEAPTTWPKMLTKTWNVTVGDGVATPALVGNKLYTFSRQGGDEITRCLDAATGKEVWKDKYPAEAVTGAASSFGGPRASPAVADGKVVTFGVDSTLSCLDAATGRKVWRKDSLGDFPRFSTSSSPIITAGGTPGEQIVITEYGGDDGGGLVAYDLATGKRKWVWNGDGAAYGSPVLMTVNGTHAVVSETAGNIVALAPADGNLLWKTPFKVRYNAATPVVDGQTVIYSGSGKGTSAVAVEKTGSGLAAKELWSNGRIGVQFNTPVIKNGLVFGISDKDQLFCLDAKTGKTAWTAPLKTYPRPNGYGSVVDAGPVLFVLNPSGELIVFEPTDKEFKKVASYSVASVGTYAYPVIADKRAFIKDKDSVTLWAIE
jgi:outer membrane protein assembly factor BamB